MYDKIFMKWYTRTSKPLSEDISTKHCERMHMCHIIQIVTTTQSQEHTYTGSVWTESDERR